MKYAICDECLEMVNMSNSDECVFNDDDGPRIYFHKKCYGDGVNYPLASPERSGLTNAEVAMIHRQDRIVWLLHCLLDNTEGQD